MPIRKKNNGKQTRKLQEAARNLGKNKLQVGHFQSDGKHSTGIGYVDLMALWAVGGPNQDAVKNPLAVLGANFRKLTEHPQFKRAIKSWMPTLDSKTSQSQMVDQLGEFILDQYKQIFGEPSSLMVGSPTNKASPLLDTGELRDKANFKVQGGR